MEGGSTRRAHLAAVADRSPEAIAELTGPPFPEALRHVWNVFAELDAHRGSTGFGPAPIGWVDLYAWCAMRGCRLKAPEIDAVLRLDHARLAASAKKG